MEGGGVKVEGVSLMIKLCFSDIEIQRDVGRFIECVQKTANKVTFCADLGLQS